MHAISTIIGAAVLLAPSALAFGSASIYNNCGVPVWYKTITTSEEAFQLVPAGGVHQPFTLEGTGVSIKLALNNTFGTPISQFEYTRYSGKIAYDISNIDGDPNAPQGYPFAQGGMDIVPSMSGDAANPTCQTVNCPAGTLVCTAAYNAPDDPRTMVCNENSDLVMTLCPGGAKKRSFNTHRHSEVHRRHSRQFK